MDVSFVIDPYDMWGLYKTKTLLYNIFLLKYDDVSTNPLDILYG